MVLDLKDAFHSLRLSENSKRLWNTSIFWESIIPVSKNAYRIEYLTLIWQSYINAILEFLQSRKCCEAIMDNLLSFTPSKKLHIAKWEDLLKALLKNGLKISPKKCQLFRTELQYRVTHIHKRLKSLHQAIKK